MARGSLCPHVLLEDLLQQSIFSHPGLVRPSSQCLGVGCEGWTKYWHGGEKTDLCSCTQTGQSVSLGMYPSLSRYSHTSGGLIEGEEVA